jgi:hypothetical protein
MSKPSISLMLDSGAFSSYTQGKIIDVNEYIAFVLKNQQYISHVINLDVIQPGSPEIAAEAGRVNFLKMREAGITTIPVFHARERTRWLDFMLDETDYIGLSGTSLVSPKEDRQWHELIWSFCSDSQGFPISRFHSFGNTSERVLLTYPWYSADSATWMIQAGRAARIKIQGKSFQIRSSMIKDTNYILAGDTGPKKQSSDEAIRALGLNPDVLLSIQGTPSQLAMLRSYLVATDLLQLQEQTVSCTKFKTPASLLSIKRQLTGGTERVGTVLCHLVLSPSAMFMNFPVVAALNIKRVLISYYYVATAPKNFWDEMLLPFLSDPVGFCQQNPKLKANWDLLQSCLVTPPPSCEDQNAIALV